MPPLKTVRWGAAVLAAAPMILLAAGSRGAVTQPRYYAHPAVHDAQGVIAPWYQGQNGQCDLRVRIAAETLKRYPWTTAQNSLRPAPHYVYNGHWRITPEGVITPGPLNDWDNGDLGQRAAYVLSGLVDYYRYSGDAAALAHAGVLADMLCCEEWQTPADHPWPRILISVPTKGKPYGKLDPAGMIQLDIVAEAGLGLLAAYQATGQRRWLETAARWGDLFAAKAAPRPGRSPWGRYANPEAAPWKDGKQTGGVVFVLYFLDELIRLGHAGADDSIVAARDAGRAYLRETLLPAWLAGDTWGRNYWDWAAAVQLENVTEFSARYLMDHKDHFPQWRTDARNVLSLFFHRTGASPESQGDAYSGAWAFPESCGCCGRSLWYGPMELAVPLAQYGAEAQSDWAREIARRMQTLATYDVHETGVSEDNIDGGQIVCGDWFKIAHPMALKHVLGTIAWMPEVFGANRENHLVRSSSVVRSVVYGKGRVEYATFDARAPCLDVLRLAFAPKSVLADGEPLAFRPVLSENGFHVRTLAGGDCIVRVRHDGRTRVVIEGDDPQEVLDDPRLAFEGDWKQSEGAGDCGGSVRAASAASAAATANFAGNQVRILGRVGPEGGLADVYVDGARQLVGIDCWNPAPRHAQVLYYKNGLAQGPHTVKVVARGAKNPLSQGTVVWLDAVQFSAAAGEAPCNDCGGPAGPQRMIFGYSGRGDYVDKAGNSWRPATEFVVRSGHGTDSVPAAWWTAPRAESIGGTGDPELYRYGVHAAEFWANLTVAPGAYRLTLRLAETRPPSDPKRGLMIVRVNGREAVRDLDVSARAGGDGKAADLSFDDVRPQNGIIEVRFAGQDGREAMVQALELAPMPR